MSTHATLVRDALSLALAAALASACGGGGGAAGTPDAAASPTLAALTTTAGVLDPPFEPGVTEYDLDLVLAEPEVAFTPTAAVVDGTTITVDGAEVASGAASPTLALALGSRDVDLVVTAAGGDATTYRVHAHRGVDALASLTPSSGALAPTFDPATTGYALRVPVDTATLAWTPTLLVPGRASVTVDGAAVASGATSTAAAVAVGDAPVAVVVTSATRPARTYDLGVFRGIDALASVTLSYAGGAVTNPLVPAFDPATSAYSLDVGVWLQQVQITVAPLDPGATITVGGGPATAGAPTPPFALNLGLTSIPIVVTAPGGDQHTYTLAVTRASVALQQAYAKASNPGAGDFFGYTVALSGDTLAVGAFEEDSAATGVDGVQGDNSAFGSGAVYVFARTGTTWSQQAYLKASNTGASDQFGAALALSGDTLVVGAGREDSAATGVGGNQADNSAPESGAVYVFTRTGTTWSQEAYLKASNPDASDGFGAAVALAGDTLAVGAGGEDSAATGIDGNQTDNTATFAGAVYVFTRAGATWSQQAYLKASNTNANDHFGSALALAGDTLAVGAWGEGSASTSIDGNQADNSASLSGAAYVFTRAGATWSQEAYLKASNTEAGDQFGGALALWGDTLAVGAAGEDSAATGVGGGQSDNSAADSGAVYLFARSGATWSRQAYVKASNSEASDGFGVSVALWGDTLAVGAEGEDSAATGVGGDEADNSAFGGGAAYVFTRAATWSQQAYLKASNTGGTDSFGSRVAASGDTVAVSGYQEDSAAAGVGGDQGNDASADSGAVYVFR